MVETKKQKQVRVDNWAKFCHQRFQTFFKNSTYCDLTLEFQDNRKLKVHRILMCVCTEYFEEYFDYLKQINQDKKSDVIVMPAALQADVVIPIINFMYTGKLEYKIANFEKLYNASKLMNMSLLTKLLEAQKQTLTPTSEAKKSQSKPGLTPVKKLKLSQSSSTSKSSAQTVSSLSHSTTTKTYPVKTCVNSQLVNKEKVSDSQLPKSTTFSKKATSSNEGHKNLECDAVIDITEDLTSDESSDETKQILIEHKDIIPTTSFDKFQFQKYLNRMPEIDSIKVEPINVELSNQTTPMLIDENDIIMPNTSFDEPQFPSDMNTMPKVNSIKTEPESSNKSTPIVIDEIDVMPSTSFDKPEFLNDLNILPKKENLEVEDMIDCIKEEAICIEENEFIKNEVSDMEDDFSDEDCFDDFDRDIRLEATPSTSVQDISNEVNFGSEDLECVVDATPGRSSKTATNNHTQGLPPECREAVVVDIPNINIFVKEEVLKLPPNSTLRKDMIKLARKKWTKKKKILQITTVPSAPKLLQCEDCFRHYSSKSFWFHLLVCEISPFRNQICDHNDPLINAFASRRTKVDQDSFQQVSAIVKQLIRILVEVRKENPDVENFLSLLRPKYFEDIQKIITRCDISRISITRSYILHMNSYLEQCCEIALNHLSGGQYTSPLLSLSDQQLELREFINLLITKRKKQHLHSSLTNKPLNSKDCSLINKILNSKDYSLTNNTLNSTISDLKLLIPYLVKTGNEAVSKLQKNSCDFRHCNTLMETIYCRMVLLNRQPPVKLLRIVTEAYQLGLKDLKSHTYKDFTKVEQILLENFEGFITYDKLIVSKALNDHIQILITTRPKVISSEYLFSQTHTIRPIYVLGIFERYAKLSGAVSLEKIKVVNLRKYIVILTYLIHMSENALQKIIQALGIIGCSGNLSHDLNLSKIAMLLILLEQGTLPNCNDHTLDEIDVQIDRHICHLRINEVVHDRIII